MIATPSPWDTEVFGYRVGILRAKPPVFAYDIKTANSGKFDVVFVKSDIWIEPYGNVEALDHLYDMEMRVGEVSGNGHALKTDASAKHLIIARTAFRDSRFLMDRRLHESASDMYVRWLARKSVYVLNGAEDNAFLLQEQDPDGALRISLVAVNEDFRGMGVGMLLVSAVLSGNPSTVWRVKVSCRNHQAIRFYEKIGFRVKSAHTAFHVWT